MVLHIITPKSAVEYQVAWLELTTPSGTLTIHKGHVPIILPIKPYTLLVFKLKTGKEQSLNVETGIVHVTRERIEAIVNPTDS